MKMFIWLLLCLLSFFADSGIATKSAGQMLDETISSLESDIAALENKDVDLANKIERLRQDLQRLKLIHGPCAPCRVSRGDEKNCDCTEYRPKKDCLEFLKAGFTVCISR